MSLNTYVQYRNVGNEWIGEIPSHWNVSPLKRLAELIVEKAEKPEYQVGLEHIESWSGNLIGTTTEFAGDGISFRSGDILFGKLRPYLAKVHLAKSEGAAVGDFFVLRPTNIDPGYFHRYILNPAVIRELDASTIGAKMPRVSWGDMALLPVAHPPEGEQRQIAAFLDHETAKIDALVAEQKRLIELLKEKRQAVISHAVTKGLDPTVPMKDSGVEWLGKVPAHWSVAAIKHLLKVPITDGPHETPEFLDDGVLFVSAEAVSTGNIDFSKAKFVSQADHERFSKKCAPQLGDIFIVKSGATTGKSAKVETNTEFSIWSPLALLRCNENNDSNYVLFTIRSNNFQAAIELYWNFGTQQNIAMSTIENLRTAEPPLAEQKLIAARLLDETARLSALRQQAERGIGLLAERRSALISAAVTGKIDVRNWRAAEEVGDTSEPWPMAAEERAEYRTR